MRPPRSLRTGLAVLATFAAFVSLPAPPAFADSTTETYIVQLKSGVSADAVVPKLLGGTAEVVDKVFQGGIADLNATQASALAKSPYVKSVHKDATISASTTQNTAPWDIDILDSPTATLDQKYTSPNDGSGVSVYVLDSGIYRAHQEFSGATIATGYDFVEDDADPQDCAGHGTEVASLIAGSSTGASKGATLVPLRVLDCSGSGFDSDVIRAAEWVVENRVAGTPAVVNLSLGAAGVDASMEAALQGLIDAGVTVVAAAGNSGVDACTESPAHLTDAITVAAVTKLHAEPSWTNYGSCVDLYAPGESVFTAGIATDHTYMSGSGTSFSAPLVAAAAAQALHDFPTWSPAEVRADVVGRAVTGVITGPGGLPARSANKLLNVNTTFIGTVPTITGLLYAGQTLHAALHWSPTPTTVTYQWLRNGAEIVGATGESYVTTADDQDQSISVSVTGHRPRLNDISGTSAAVIPAVPPDPGMVVTMTPSRLMDSRIGLGATGPLRNGQTVSLPVAGVGSIMSSASAVLVNITVTEATSPGFVTAYASGDAIPATSNANFTAGTDSANLAMVRVGPDGKIAFTARLAGTIQLVVDVQSYVVGGVVKDAGAVVPVTPTRLVDTRWLTPLRSGEILPVQVTGRAGVPDDATAVFVNVTVTEPQANGHLTVFPSSETIPATSNLNFVTGLTVPNMAVVKVNSDGWISIRNASPGTAQVVVDVQGYITAGTPTTAGAVIPISPVRIVDTRLGLGAQGPVGSGVGVVVTATGGSIPAASQGVFMNLTVTEPTAGGWMSAYPTQATQPLVSNLNFVAGQTVPNLATVGLKYGQATLYNGSGGTVQVVADLFAYIL